MNRTVHVLRSPSNRRWHVEIVQMPSGSFYPITCNNDSGWNDNPLRLEDGRILYDFPERIPKYAKKLTTAAFRWIDRHKKE